VAADALDRRAGEMRAERCVVQSRQLGERGGIEVVAGGELRLSRRLGVLVPGADGEAIVAAIDAVADGLPEFVRDRSLVLDRQVGDAAPRIEPVGCREGVGRADVEAGLARAA